jgi:hypothetical protein
LGYNNLLTTGIGKSVLGVRGWGLWGFWFAVSGFYNSLRFNIRYSIFIILYKKRPPETDSLF